MTREEIDILMSESVRVAVEANIGCDPVRVALDKRIPHAALVATQVKYLQRARTKLPSYYAARCVIPPLAFEQASSELTACGKDYSGSLCVDLTCGLGVDALALARRFAEVVAVERDPDLAYLAGCNFKLLGAHNIRVVNMSAEEFIDANADLRPDMIYADPDRRNTLGRKLVRLEDCSPDIVSMLSRLRSMTGRIVVKMSPMFDVDEAFRIIGERTRIEVVSVGGECKEVVAETGNMIEKSIIAASVSGFGRVEYDRDRSASIPDRSVPESPEYLIVPDAALAKARIAKRYFAQAGLAIEGDNSYAFGNVVPDSVPGKAYRITAMARYSPARLKKELKLSGIRRIDILKRDFPHSTAEIARQLGVAEGGDVKIAFTRRAGSPVAIFITPV